MYLDNKYTTIYYQIIDKAKLRKIPNTYYEKHHIIPKSLGGTNKKENLVALTAREHFICHWLLTKMVVDQNSKWKMINALGFMIWSENENQQRYKINSRLYEQLRKKHSEHKSWAQYGERNGFYGKQHSLETKQIMSEKAKGRIPWNKGKPFKGAGMTGKNHSEKTKQRLSEIKKHFKHNEESKKKTSDALKGITRSDDTKKKMSEAKKGIVHPRKICEHCSKETTVSMYARWHGVRCRHYSSS
jgi:hypothetical protein